MSYYYNTTPTTGVTFTTITSTKCVFIITCKLNVGVTVLLLML